MRPNADDPGVAFAGPKRSTAAGPRGRHPHCWPVLALVIWSSLCGAPNRLPIRAVV